MNGIIVNGHCEKRKVCGILSVNENGNTSKEQIIFYLGQLDVIKKSKKI